MRSAAKRARLPVIRMIEMAAGGRPLDKAKIVSVTRLAEDHVSQTLNVSAACKSLINHAASNP